MDGAQAIATDEICQVVEFVDRAFGMAAGTRAASFLVFSAISGVSPL